MPTSLFNKCMNTATVLSPFSQVFLQFGGWNPLFSAFPDLWVRFLIFNVRPMRRAKPRRHVSILFPSAVCTVYCFELGWACAASGCGGYRHSGPDWGTVVSDATRVGDTRWHKHSWTNMFTLLEPAPGLTPSCLLDWLIDSDAAAAGVTTDPEEAAVTRGLIWIGWVWQLWREGY